MNDFLKQAHDAGVQAALADLGVKTAYDFRGEVSDDLDYLGRELSNATDYLGRELSNAKGVLSDEASQAMLAMKLRDPTFIERLKGLVGG
jgi:hypothetical protein